MDRDVLYDLPERIWLVPQDHPYCTGRNHVPDVYRVGDEWKIAWRSFDTMKQDNVYPTEQQARAAAQSIALSRVTASAYDEAQLKEFSELWIETAGLPRSQHARFTFTEITAAG